MSRSPRLVGVYNARGGLVGELSYIVGKLRGAAHCALCDISHGYRPTPKRAWKDLVGALPVPLTTVHLNEMDAATAAVISTTRCPAVVYLDGQNDRVLLDSAELEQCNANIASFSLAINEALNRIV